ncbi:MAG: DUF1592 domain-containing protein [Zetaproteobacteria bacterium]|nr:DUF1592 domain-containing protein [Zetaproteobacteria bacterium]
MKYFSYILSLWWIVGCGFSDGGKLVFKTEVKQGEDKIKAADAAVGQDDPMDGMDSRSGIEGDVKLFAGDGEKGIVDDPMEGANAVTCEPEPANLGARLWTLTHDQVLGSVENVFEIRLDRGAVPQGWSFPKINSFSNNAKISSVTDGDYEKYKEVVRNLCGQIAAKSPFIKACPQKNQSCSTQFVTRHAPMLFRGQPNAALEREIAAVYQVAKPASFARGFDLVCQRMLHSPHFVYRKELPSTQADDIQVSLRTADILAFALTNASPDKQLYQDALAGKVVTREQVTGHVNRLLSGDQAKTAGIKKFYQEYLGHDLSKHHEDLRKKYPKLGERYASELSRSVSEYVQDLYTSEQPDFGQLLGTRDFFADAFLSDPFKRDLVGGGAQTRFFEKNTFSPDGQRHGIFTHPAVLMAHAALGSRTLTTIHRGVFTLEKMLCVHIPAPPNNAENEKVEDRRVDPRCKACHIPIEGIGVPLNAYDEIGRLAKDYIVSKEGQQAIRGDLGKMGIPGLSGTFTNPVEMMTQMGKSPRVSRCFTENSMSYILGVAADDLPACRVKRIERDFRDVNYDLKQLLTIILTDAYTQQRSTAGQ